MVFVSLLPPNFMVSYSHKKWNMGAVTSSSKNLSQHLRKLFGASWLTSSTGLCSHWSLSASFSLSLAGSTRPDRVCWDCAARAWPAPRCWGLSALHAPTRPQNKQQASETLPTSTAKRSKFRSLPFKLMGSFVQDQWCDTAQVQGLTSRECDPLAPT